MSREQICQQILSLTHDDWNVEEFSIKYQINHTINVYFRLYSHIVLFLKRVAYSH
jgi:hypothetical protein